MGVLAEQKRRKSQPYKPSFLDNVIPLYGITRRTKHLAGQYQQGLLDIKLAQRRYLEAADLLKPNVGVGEAISRSNWQAKPVRAQARYLYDNDSTTRTIVDAMAQGLIGKGVRFLVNKREGEPDANIELIEQAWLSFSKSVKCDYDEVYNFPGLELLILTAACRDGMVFVRFVRWPKNEVPMQLQVLEAEYLNVEVNSTLENGNTVHDGIEFDKWGKVKAYYFFTEHPDDNEGPVKFTKGKHSSKLFSARETIRVPAAEVCCIRKITRPGQRDGVSWLAPVMTSIWDLKEYKEAQLKQQKIQACIPAIVVDTQLPEMFYETTDMSEFKLGTETADIGATIEPGSVKSLPFGKDVRFPNPSAVPNQTFVERALRDISGSLGQAYEIFDYSKANFSSARMGFLQTSRNYETIFNTILVPQFYEKLGDRFIFAMKSAGMLPEEYDDAQIRWVPEHREMIDPQKEVAAVVALVQSGLISMKEAHARLGLDFTKNVAEIKESEDYLKQNGLDHFIQKEEPPPAP